MRKMTIRENEYGIVLYGSIERKEEVEKLGVLLPRQKSEPRGYRPFCRFPSDGRCFFLSFNDKLVENEKKRTEKKEIMVI